MKVDKISNKRLKITTDIIKFVNKSDLEEDKLMLESRLAGINILLDVFKEIK